MYPTHVPFGYPIFLLVLAENNNCPNVYLIILAEDISISFSKKRYRASVQFTAPLGTSVVTVRANAGNSKNSVHYYIVSVNGKPFNANTALFDMDPVIGIYNIFIKTCLVNNLSLMVTRTPSHRLR